MIVALTRTVILYIFVIIAVRLMGKRQIGQLQPSELVITLLMSEIAALPIEDADVPLIGPLICAVLLVSFEILFSYMSLKSSFFRRMTQGNLMYIIKEGKVDIKQMKRLRFTVEDLMEALRQKDIFDLKDVDYAIVETNGSLSVLQKADKRTVCPEDLKIKADNEGIPCVVISDGRIVETNFQFCNMNKRKLENIMLIEKKKINDIMIMTYDKAGNYFIVEKEAGK